MKNINECCFLNSISYFYRRYYDFAFKIKPQILKLIYEKD